MYGASSAIDDESSNKDQAFRNEVSDGGRWAVGASANIDRSLACIFEMMEVC